MVFGCGAIGLAAAVALKHFCMKKVMLCDVSEFHLGIAEKLGFAVCNTKKEDFPQKAAAYLGTAASLSGSVPNIDCWIDAAGAESVLDDYMRYGKIISRFVIVAVNNKPRQIDLLHMTYAQKSIIGSGGYFPEYVDSQTAEFLTFAEQSKKQRRRSNSRKNLPCFWREDRHR